MNFKYLLIVALTSMASLQAQNAKGYEVATWHQFKTAALSYTFDDNCANQIPIALPLFDFYGYKTTHFSVSSWIKDWSGLQRAAANGHEIASHTVTHPWLSKISLETQEEELKEAKNTILSNIMGSKCETVAYPFCDIGDTALVRKYYAAGRVCTGTVEQSTPKNFYAIGSVAIGDQTDVVNSNDLNRMATLAKEAKGWSIFLIHGIDNDGGYSPVLSKDLKSHLDFVHADSTQYWVSTFAQVFKYIKERNTVKLTEDILESNTLLLLVTDSLDDMVYNVPITIRRILPKGWKDVKVYKGDAEVPSFVRSIGPSKYIEFDVVPDQGSYFIVKKDKQAKK